ncbi:MAG: TraB/GumN family protein [Pseudomonadota bacterium]
MFRLLPTLLALLALASCTPPAPKQDADPALWVVRDADTTIYLFGTVHTLKPGLGWFDEAVRDAFDRSDSLVLELVLPPQDELQKLVQELGANSGALSAQLPPETAMRLHDALARMGQAPDALDASEAWLAAIQLANMPVQATGYDPRDGAEAVLSQAARKAGKPVSGLESAREQFGYFDRLSPAAQQAMLSETIDGLPKAQAVLDAIVAAWAKGDTAAIGTLINDDLMRSPELARALLVQRNHRWADWIAARMKTPGTVFVAVGAGHLAGRHGLQGDLQRRGMTVYRVRY